MTPWKAAIASPLYTLLAASLAALLALAGCEEPAPQSDPPYCGAGMTAPNATADYPPRLVELGDDCLVAAYVEVHDGRAYVTCGGPWGADTGRLVVLDLADLEVLASTHLGGLAGDIAISGEHVFVADGTEGRLFVTDLDGEVLHDQDDPVVLCPSDPEAELQQFIMGVEATAEGGLLASCSRTSEVLRFDFEPGADDGESRHALVTGRGVAGDGPSSLALWGDSHAVVLDALAGTSSLLELGETIEVDVGRWLLGEGPTGLAVVGDSAYVTNATSHTLQVLDLAHEPPSAATVQEVYIGDATSPDGVAVLPGGMALVSLLMANQLALIDPVGGSVEACIELPSSDALSPFEGAAASARPQSIALTGDGRAIVTLNNVDEHWMPAGPGLVVVLDLGEPAE